MTCMVDFVFIFILILVSGEPKIRNASENKTTESNQPLMSFGSLSILTACKIQFGKILQEQPATL